MRKRRGPFRPALGAVCAALVLAAVLAPAEGIPGAKDEIAVVLKDKIIRDLSSAGLVLAFHVGLKNPTSAPRALVRYRYRVTVNQREFLNLTVPLDEPLAVPAGAETIVALPVKITYDLLEAAVGPIEGRAVCDIVGDMYFVTERKKEQRVPFAFSGEFPIFEDPEIVLLPLKVNDLTVGGADVVFRPRFKNLNIYELIVDRISYTLSFMDAEVLSGSVPGDKNLPSSGGKSFELPFLLDFFEAGESMREAFRKEAFACRFAGEIEVASVWGRLIVRFDMTQELRLEKAP